MAFPKRHLSNDDNSHRVFCGKYKTFVEWYFFTPNLNFNEYYGKYEELYCKRCFEKALKIKKESE